MEVTLKVFWIPTEIEEMIADGKSVDVSNFETEERTFYIIANVSPYEGNFCVVASDGCDFIANESFNSVRRKIRESKKQAMFNEN